MRKRSSFSRTPWLTSRSAITSTPSPGSIVTAISSTSPSAPPAVSGGGGTPAAIASTVRPSVSVSVPDSTETTRATQTSESTVAIRIGSNLRITGVFRPGLGLQASPAIDELLQQQRGREVVAGPP